MENMSGKKNHIGEKSIDLVLFVIYSSGFSNLEPGPKRTGWLYTWTNKNTDLFLVFSLQSKTLSDFPDSALLSLHYL
jgi:hypothetical protein